MAEVTRPLSGRGHAVEVHNPLQRPLPVIVGEEKHLIFNDFSTHGAAELIAAISGLRLAERIEVIACVHVAVAQVIEGFAVKRVGTRAGRDRNYACATTELCRISSGQDLELGNRFHRRLNHHGVKCPLIVVDAVDHPGVGIGLAAEGIEIRRRAGIE